MSDVTAAPWLRNLLQPRHHVLAVDENRHSPAGTAEIAGRAEPSAQMLWFGSPKAGCANTVTPFNGTHNAGIQVLNTANFPALSGPLHNFNP